MQETRNPLRNDEGALAGNSAEFSGYEQHTQLRIVSGQAARVGIWNLIQMPHGGEMFIPTFVRAERRIYFGEIPKVTWSRPRTGIRWIMRANGKQKLELKATATTGRVGYRFGESEESLVIRNFSVDRVANIDTPWTDTDDYGYSVQACNVDSKWGSFSELEYHVPAIGDGTGATASEDMSQVWAFRGSTAELDKISDLLLGQRANGMPIL